MSKPMVRERWAPAPPGVNFQSRYRGSCSGRRQATMILPGKTEAGSAGTQPCRGIAWRAHLDDERSASASLPRSSKTHIGSVDPDALKIPTRRAEYSLMGSGLPPFQADPTQTPIRTVEAASCNHLPRAACKLDRSGEFGRASCGLVHSRKLEVHQPNGG